MINVVALIDGLRKATGTDEADLPDEEALLALNQSYWELLDKFPFREKEARGTFPTVDGTRIYNVPEPFEALRSLTFINPDTEQHVPIKQMSTEKYEEVYSETDDNKGMPTNYIREGCQIILYPTPNAAYNIVMRYWTTLADLSDTQDPDMPRSWHELIKYGAIWRVFIDNGDYVRGNAAQKVQERLINSAVPVEAKEEVDNSHAHLEVIRADYP